jgi:selenide,water dikinase
MKRLVLIGAGLAHLEVLRRLAMTPLPDTEIILITKDRQAVYAGMLPGVVAGHYAPDQMTVDAAGLARAAKVGFRQGAISGLDLARSEVILDDATRLGFSFLSLNTGAWPRDIGLDRSLPVLKIKPAPAFVDALQDWENQVSPGAPVGVVGGGAAGIELALALAHRWGDSRPAPILIERSGLRLDRIPAAARRPLRRHLARAGIAVHTAATAPDLALAINAAGAAPPDWLAQSGLARTALGYLAIRPTLQVAGQDHIFASGDMASMADHPRAKAGVFAVRQGPVLFANLQRALAGDPLLAHRPQSDWLSLIGTGPKHAIATRNGIALQGRWAWRIKDINDRSYLARYRALLEKDMP